MAITKIRRLVSTQWCVVKAMHHSHRIIEVFNDRSDQIIPTSQLAQVIEASEELEGMQHSDSRQKTNCQQEKSVEGDSAARRLTSYHHCDY